MKLNGLRLEVILTAFAVMALAVFGAEWLIDRYEVVRPLVSAASRVDGVRRVALVKEGGRTDLVVTMGPSRDFRTSYGKLAELLKGAYGQSGGRVVVRDNRTDRLGKALYELNFALQEGLTTGRFREMRAVVETQARALNLAPPYLWVEGGRIYLGLREGDAVLYAVIERIPASSGAQGREGGGSLG